MTVKFPPIIQRYVSASNLHDVRSILACFADEAIIYDEGEILRGKKDIESWIVKTIDKYKFQFQLLGIEETDGETIVAISVSGTFDGSPVSLDYHFTFDGDRIASLRIH